MAIARDPARATPLPVSRLLGPAAVLFPDPAFIADTASTLSSSQIQEMEKVILTVLRFQMCVVTTRSFIRRFLSAANLSIPPQQADKLSNLAHVS